jgi:ABC-2 type transport system permease protein
MKSIALREIKSFFGSPIGYLVIAIFLLLNGLFLWVFDGEYNILQSGFADLSPFFTLSPWILIFLIPAVTMRSFSDEKKQGTIELLLTKPLSIWQIVNGKFLGAFLFISNRYYSNIDLCLCNFIFRFPEGNIDLGSIMGSYFGLIIFSCSLYFYWNFTSTLIRKSNCIVYSFGIFVFFFLLWF